MWDMLRAEGLKISRSRSVILGCVGLIVLFTLVLFGSRTNERDYIRTIEYNRRIVDHPEDICNQATGRCYDQLFRENPRTREIYVRQVAQGESALRAARAASSPSGMAGMILAVMGSGVGAAIALLLGAHVVGIELSSRTLPLVFSRRPRRWQTFLAKVITAFAVYLMTTVVVVGIVAGIAAIVSSGPVDAAALALPSLAYQMALPLITGIFFATIGVGLTFLIRSTIAPIAVVVVWLAAEFAVTRFAPVVRPWTLIMQMWSLGSGFHARMSNSTGSYWMWPSMLGGTHSLVRVSLHLAVFAAVFGAATSRRFRTDERF